LAVNTFAKVAALIASIADRFYVIQHFASRTGRRRQTRRRHGCAKQLRVSSILEKLTYTGYDSLLTYSSTWQCAVAKMDADYVMIIHAQSDSLGA
jgi:hypothetical protein